MSIVFRCSYCGKKLAAADSSAGKEKTCPKCRARVVVPTAEKAAAEDTGGVDSRHEAADHPLLLVGRRPEHKDLIDMTAMVDIVFFLLIFFLVTSMQSIEAVINLPTPQGSANSPSNVQAVPEITNDPNFVVVTIDADDAMFVDDEEVHSEQELRSKLRRANKEQERTGLMINGSADATHGRFVMVLDAGADAGMKEILFSVPQAEGAAGGS